MVVLVGVEEFSKEVPWIPGGPCRFLSYDVAGQKVHTSMCSTCFKIEALVNLIEGCVIQVLAERRVDCSAIQIWIPRLKTALDE